jgi:hypothetical protein
MSELDEERELKPLLATFRCCQDEEIEQFLHGRAVEFEKLSKSRTYLVCDEEELQSKNINQLTIYGYISLALKILTVPPNVSNRIRKEIDGFSSKLHGEQISDFSCYLIGQLSRNSNVQPDNLSGRQILSFAEDVISTAVEAVGGRYMMIECRDEEKLIKFYSDNHFIEISRIPDRQQAMVQMIRKI